VLRWVEETGIEWHCRAGAAVVVSVKVFVV
jgi:hypothetical protein